MKICMMTNTYLPHVGGVARSVSTLANELRRLRHRVMIVAPEFEGRPLPQRQESIVDRVPAIQKFNGSDFSVRLPFAAGFSDRLVRFNADIVHSHHPFLLGDTALRIAANKNVPIVFTHHTRYEDYTHYVPFDSPALKEFAIKMSTDYANLCDGVIAPSESIATLIKKRGVNVPIRVVPTGIDVAAFASGDARRGRARHGLPANAFVVGHVGRLAPEKNLPFLADAVSRFIQATPNAWFLVVGSGPSWDDLRERFEKDGIADRLVLAGSQTGRALHDAYAAMDVFAFASQTETQGLVLAEAMAAGLPVVAVDASGTREVVADAENGFLLSPRASAGRLAAALAKLHGSPRRLAAFSRAARVTAAGFARERCAERALGFYDFIRRLTRRERLIADQSPWGVLLQRIAVEWDLLATRTQGVVDAVFNGARGEPAEPTHAGAN